MTNPFNQSSTFNYALHPGWGAAAVQPGVGGSADPLSSPMKPGSFYFMSPEHVAYFEQTRLGKRQYNVIHRPGLPWTEDDELNLVNKLHIDWFDEPYISADTNIEMLDLGKLKTLPLRQKELPQFKIDYQSYPEIKLRLLNTVISIKGHPFLVSRITTIGAKFRLTLTNAAGKRYNIWYSDIKDLRTIPPMYISPSGTGWLNRIPGRIYQQGLTRQNTMLFSIDSKSVVAHLDPTKLLVAIENRANRSWNETTQSLMLSGDLSVTRLSDNIAVRGDGQTLTAFYRGRELGLVRDNEILVDDEDDMQQQWIEQSAKDVNLLLRAA